MKALWERAFEAFRRMIPAPAADGFGGYGTVFSEGEPFRGTAVPAQDGEMDGGPLSVPGGRVRILAEGSASLRYGDTVRREADGALFRITGEIRRPPENAGFGFIWAPGERISGEEGVSEDGWRSLSGGSADGAGNTEAERTEAER